MQHAPGKILGHLLLAAFYLLASLRYVPDQAIATLLATLTHLLSALPLTIGATILLTALLKRVTGHPLARTFIFRLFCTMGIAMELLYGLYDYLSRHQPPLP